MWLKEIRPGAFAGDRWHPIPSVALYVPRGKGAFPSVTMMTTVPAVVAGVPEIAILTPPTPEGTADAATLVAAKLAGVETVYKCGGAQAVAAAAYGTETVRKAVKILGPGSPFVVAAKRLLSDVIDVGTPAGPSESIVLADGTADGRVAALDLLIEAEHGPELLRLSRDARPRRCGSGARRAARILGEDAGAARRLLESRAERPARRHRADALDRGLLSLRQRLRAGAPGDPFRQIRSSISAASRTQPRC